MCIGNIKKIGENNMLFSHSLFDICRFVPIFHKVIKINSVKKGLLSSHSLKWGSEIVILDPS